MLNFFKRNNNTRIRTQHTHPTHSQQQTPTTTHMCSSNQPQQQQTEESRSSSKKPSACAECRRVHKKCDKQRPCSRCVSTCVDCVDVCPGKRGRPRKVVNPAPSHLDSLHHKQQMQYQSCINLTRDEKNSVVKKRKLVFHSEYNYASKKFKSSETLTSNTDDFITSNTPTTTTRKQQPQHQPQVKPSLIIPQMMVATQPHSVAVHKPVVTMIQQTHNYVRVINQQQPTIYSPQSHLYNNQQQVPQPSQRFYPQQQQPQMTIFPREQSPQHSRPQQSSSPLWNTTAPSPIRSQSNLPSIRDLGLDSFPLSPTNTSSPSRDLLG